MALAGWGVDLLKYRHSKLVGGFNPFENYVRQIGSSPQGSGCKFEKKSNHHHPNTGCLIGFLIFYYNPCITGEYNPLL